MSRRVSRLLHFVLVAVLAIIPVSIVRAQEAASASGPAGGANLVSVRVLFGLKRLTPTRWDGEIRVSGGRVLKIDGVHFEGRDKIQGANQWLLTTRVTRYADSTTPRGYDPVHTRPYAMIPNGVVATLDAPPDATVTVETEAGRFSFKLGDPRLGTPIRFLDGEASAERLPSTRDLTRQDGYNDYPSLTTDKAGLVWASWISYAERKDTVWVARHDGSGWGSPVRVAPPGYDDNFRTRVAADAGGKIWVVWTGRQNGRWGLHARSLEGEDLSDVTTLADGESGPNLYHDVVADSEGRLHVVWQGFRGQVSHVLHRAWDGSRWSPERTVSSGTADHWAPAAAADSSGNVWVGWDGYEAGDFNIYLRRISDSGQLGRIRQVTQSPTFDANVSLACDGRDRLWISWDHGEVNWGKDWTSQRFKPGGGAGLYRTRAVRVAVLEGETLRQPASPIMSAVPPEYKDYFQQARLQPDGHGRIWVMARSLTSFVTRVNNNWGAGGIWEVLVSRLGPDGWLPATKLHGTNGRNDAWAASTKDREGKLWFAWSRDDREFGTTRPTERRNPIAKRTNVSYTVIDPTAADSGGEIRLVPFQETPVTVRTVHENEPEDLGAIRSYRVEAGGKTYRILRGDLHRHTDISGDGIGDGGLIDFYRYALTAGQYDFMMVGDHQYGGGREGLEYNWWRTEKSEDIYLAPGRFWPLFGTERSLSYPNGHRNTVFAKRGIRELAIDREERSGKKNTGSVLYPYLRANGGIATSHTSGTDQGTDWRDSDAELEPVVEIYQGLHASYEYVGAPRAETPDKRYYHHGAAWRPEGFVWEAWEKGIKLGVQASSDHIATHDAYACILVEADKFSERQDLIDAMKARHTYAATDNIILDVRIGEHIMGDAFETTERPVLMVRAIGTRPIAKVVVIKNNQIIHTTEPGAKQVDFEYRDAAAEKGNGESYYYVRVEQSDGSLAWSSPIWVTYR